MAKGKVAASLGRGEPRPIIMAGGIKPIKRDDFEEKLKN